MPCPYFNPCVIVSDAGMIHMPGRFVSMAYICLSLRYPRYHLLLKMCVEWLELVDIPHSSEHEAESLSSVSWRQ